MELEEAIKNLKKQLENTKKANECGLATKGEFKEDIQAIETVLQALENSIAKGKIEDKIKKLDSKKEEDRVIKIYTQNKRYYYETDMYNDIIKQVLQELLEE